MYAKILVAFDGSEPARRALTHAKAISEVFGSKLEIVHVYAYPTFAFGEALVPIPQNYEIANYEYAQQVIQEAESKVMDIPNASVTLLQGHPAKSLIDYANQSQCDLIVIGSRGLGGLKEFMLGSVSHNVVQQTKIPTLIIR